MSRENKNIPFSGPDIIDLDIKNVESVIKSGWLTHGKFTDELEELFCSYTGAKYATTVSNCTAALHLSCIAAEFGPNDEVIVPAQTHTATSHAVEFTGANAVFADVDPVTGNISYDEIKKKYSDRTKGVIPVHMAGVSCNMDEINNFCNDKGIILIEDCAHGIGTRFNDVHAGNYGITGCFSFYPTKQITTGEGGIVISNNEEILEKIRKLKAFGIDTPPEMRSKPGLYDVMALGYNYRMTDFQAALGAGQMRRYDENLAQRKKNALRYSHNLKNIQGLTFSDYSDNNSYFLFQIILDSNINRDEVLFKLKDKNIGVSIHYATPVPLMSYYKEKYSLSADEFPNALEYANQSISIPVHSKLSESDVDFVSEVLINILEKI